MCVTLLNIKGTTCRIASNVCYCGTYQRNNLQDCLKCVLLCYISKEELVWLPQLCVTLLQTGEGACRIASNVCYSVTYHSNNFQDCLKCALLCYISKQQFAELPQMCVILLQMEGATCRIASNVYYSVTYQSNNLQDCLKCVTLLQIKEATRKIASKFEITGPFNIQFLVKDGDVQVSGLFLWHPV